MLSWLGKQAGTVGGLWRLIGHLPREISRATRFFLLRGGVVHAEVMDKNHRRSPLVQGGLEIPVEVIVEMDATTRNRAILEKYKQIVIANYKEPGQDGKFDDCTKEVLKELMQDEDSDPEEAVEESVESLLMFDSGLWTRYTL